MATPRRIARARSVAVGAIVAISAGLQFYRINDWQSFSDDQATQLNVVHGMLVDHHLPLLGLALSVGSAHIGPLFYYLLAVPMALGQALVGFLDPTAGVIMVGLFQVGTVYLLYRLCVLVEAPWAGLCSAGLYATSQLVVYWSRFLWPNITPFFVVLTLYALVALAKGRPRFLPLLAASLAAAAQMQPTAVLLVPVAILWLIAVRPRITLRLAVVSAGLAALLFAPAILYDVTHRFAETRAWLSYATTVAPSHTPRNGFARGVQEMAQFAWHAVGFRSRSPVDLLLSVAALAVLTYAAGLGGHSRALLARLLALWAGVYVLAFALYRGALHPHYVEPLYPLPFLGIGLLLDLVVTSPRRLRVSQWIWPARERPLPRVLATLILGAGSIVVVAGLATANVRHLWADHFALDAFQLGGGADVAGNRVGLVEMRRAASIIARSAGTESYSFLTAVRDGSGGGFAYLQRREVPPPATSLRPLQFLLVEPAGRPPWLWPAATRERWSHSTGGFIKLPHLLLWRLRLPGDPRDEGPVSWQNTADTAGEVTTLAVSPDGSGRIIAGYIGGAATLIPHRQAWKRAVWPAAPNGRGVISAFAWSATCPRRVYAATFGGLMMSTDGGATWGAARTQPSSSEILALLADPHRCGVVLAGTRKGIAHTEDGGTHWQMVAIGGRRRLAVHALAGDPFGDLVYAGTTDGVWVSFDGGRTWPPRRQRCEPRPALSLLPHPGEKALLLAGSGAGVLASADGGLTWTPVGGSPRAVVYTLLDVDSHGTLLAGTDAGLYISHDDGGFWQPAPLPAGISVKALVQGPGHAVYAGSDSGVYRSGNGGVTWQRI